MVMKELIDPIRLETATFPIHQVSHKIPLLLEFSQTVRASGVARGGRGAGRPGRRLIGGGT